MAAEPAPPDRSAPRRPTRRRRWQVWQRVPAPHAFYGAFAYGVIAFYLALLQAPLYGWHAGLAGLLITTTLLIDHTDGFWRSGEFPRARDPRRHLSMLEALGLYLLLLAHAVLAWRHLSA